MPRAVTYVSVIGQNRTEPDLTTIGEELGRRLADAGFIVVCGGMGGVMSAVARGVADRDGVSIGLLPGLDRDEADPQLTFSVCTGIGHARNLAVAASGDIVIAVGGQWGTLSEIALARCADRPVILLDSWTVTPRRGAVDGVLVVETPAQAVATALSIRARSLSDGGTDDS